MVLCAQCSDIVIDTDDTLQTERINIYTRGNAKINIRKYGFSLFVYVASRGGGAIRRYQWPRLVRAYCGYLFGGIVILLVVVIGN